MPSRTRCSDDARRMSMDAASARRSVSLCTGSCQIVLTPADVMTLATLSLAAGIVFFILMFTRHDARRQLFKGLAILFALLTIGLFEFFLKTDAQLPNACGTANEHLSTAECDKAASDASGSRDTATNNED
jgi:hypothetical protein